VATRGRRSTQATALQERRLAGIQKQKAGCSLDGAESGRCERRIPDFIWATALFLRGSISAQRYGVFRMTIKAVAKRKIPLSCG
jgi:hypothetical protein